jgi:HPt (histidine-containing phosphotransfer) domain-containing protein
MSSDPVKSLNSHNVDSAIDSNNPMLDKLSQFMDKGALTELVLSFSTRSLHYIEKAKDSIEQKDLENLRFALHSLKGSSSNVGLHEFSASCEQLEQSVKTSDLVDYSILVTKVKQLSELLDVSKQQLQAYLSRLA